MIVSWLRVGENNLVMGIDPHESAHISANSVRQFVPSSLRKPPSFTRPKSLHEPALIMYHDVLSLFHCALSCPWFATCERLSCTLHKRVPVVY